MVSQVWPWGESFNLGETAGGVRDNQGAEALARWPDGRLVAGLEQPLYRDAPASSRNGRPFGGGHGGFSRLVEWHPTEEGWRMGRQWAYPLDATPPREGYEAICDDGELGLVELLALDAGRLLSLERACLIDPATRRVRNVIQIFEVRVDGADDVTGRSLLGATDVRPVSKQLVLDLDTVRTALPPALAGLDNFEGMAEGPRLPDGRRTIIVVSDDNFRQTQVTAFLLLAMP
jgi:3-phytase